MHGAHADHLAGGNRDLFVDAAPDELARRLALAEKLAGEVDSEHRVPLVERHVEEGRILLQPGVGDRDVQRAEFGDRLLVHRDDLVLFRDVGLDGQRATPKALDLVSDVVGRLGMRHVVDDDVGPGLREAQRDGLADAGVRTGDDRRLAFEHVRIPDLRQGMQIGRCRRIGSLGVGHRRLLCRLR